MIGLLKAVLSFNFLFGLIVGLIGMYFFRPLVDAGIKKIIEKNS